jgi:hypothetical protein
MRYLTTSEILELHRLVIELAALTMIGNLVLNLDEVMNQG